MFKCFSILLFAAVLSTTALNASEKGFVRYDTDTTAIVGVTVIDGTGAPAAENQTVVMHEGRILAVGSVNSTPVPENATVIDGAGKTLLPGLVMMHEHMFYPTGDRNYTEMLKSFPLLYIAGGATTVRTAGTLNPYGDLNLNAAIQAGEMIGPDIDVTAPYLEGPGLPILKIKALKGARDAERMVTHWAEEGVTSYKAYMHISQDELASVIKEAHKRKHKVTAHLCSVTYREAAAFGIDNLEHGFMAMTDFVETKEKDKCPKGRDRTQSLVNLDIDGDAVKSLIDFLVAKNVAITSTLTIYETFTPGRPKAPESALEVLIPQVRAQYETQWQRVADADNEASRIVFEKTMKLERMFVDAGGTLLVGTDPTGFGGVIAGFANLRAIELLVEAGFSMSEAIHMSTLEGARFLGRDANIGSINVGKRADIVLIDGRPDQHADHINRVDVVFKNGVGYSSAAIRAAMRETVGLH